MMGGEHDEVPLRVWAGLAQPLFLWLIQHFRFTAQVRRCDVRGAHQLPCARTNFMHLCLSPALSCTILSTGPCCFASLLEAWCMTSYLRYDPFWLSLARVQIRGRNNTKQLPPSRSIQYLPGKTSARHHL